MQDVRDDALHLLDVLSSRIWKDSLKDSKGAAADASASLSGQSEQSQPRVAVVIGNLQDSYQQFQYQLSAKIARYTIRDLLQQRQHQASSFVEGWSSPHTRC